MYHEEETCLTNISERFFNAANEDLVSSVQIKSLKCERNDVVIFQNMSFSMCEGSVLQVVGRNGSGKTTLLRAICGLMPVSEGEIYYNSKLQDRESFYQNLVFIGHKLGIKEGLSVIENMRLIQALGTSRENINLQDVIERLGLRGYEDEWVKNLSAGQKRRVALSRLLLLSGKLWILDEPFTALDVSGVDLITELLEQHATNGGMVLITSHQDFELDSIKVTRIFMQS